MYADRRTARNAVAPALASILLPANEIDGTWAHKPSCTTEWPDFTIESNITSKVGLPPDMVEPGCHGCELQS